MKKLQLVNVTYTEGKKTDSEKLGEEKKVADSIADHLLLEAKFTIEEIVKNKSNATVKVWEDKGDIKKPAKKKPVKKKTEDK